MILRSPLVWTAYRCVTPVHKQGPTDTQIPICKQGKGDPACHPAGGPSCPELPGPPLLTHSRTPPSALARVYCAPIGCMAQPRALARHPFWSQGGGPLVQVQAPELVTSMDKRRGPNRKAKEAVHQPAGGGQAAQRPSWLAACLHTWLNRDNGGCSSTPASFPEAEPRP